MIGGWEGAIGAAVSLLLGGGGMLASYTLSDRLLPSAGPAMRWTATAVTGMTLASGAFHLLLAAGMFKPLPAIGAVVLAVIVAFVVRRPGFVPAESLRADLVGLHRFVFPPGAPTAVRLGTALGWAALTAVAIRALLVPVVAWDSMTYHAVKAGLWVQQGGPIDLVAPGGWSIYGSYLGGGESFVAWAMLPFRNDLLAGLPDALQWLLLGVALAAVGAELGLSRTARCSAAIFGMTLPTAVLAVGSLYVDTTLALLLVASLALALRAVRLWDGAALALSLAALGLACGIKLFAWPVAAAMAITLGLIWLIGARGWRLWIGPLVGTPLAILGVLPWLIHNLARTGLPLSPVPMTLLGVPLGRVNDAMQWYLDRPELAEVGSRAEWLALARLFGLPGFSGWAGPTLGPVTLLPALLALPGLMILARRVPRAALLVAALVLPLLVSFSSAGLRPTRLIWAAVSGRYLLAAATVVVLLAWIPLDRNRVARPVLAGLLALGTVYHLGIGILPIWERHEMLVCGIAALLLVGLLGRSFRLRGRRWPLARVTVSAIAVGLLALASLSIYRDATLDAARRTRHVLHRSPRFWVDAAARLDLEGSPRIIAFTAGPHQDADNQVLYPFLGRRLQNRLVYVPVGRDGEIVDPVRVAERTGRADPRAWLERLDEAGVTEVIAFGPPSLELYWMESNPQSFERLEGNGAEWGLYRRRPR